MELPTLLKILKWIREENNEDTNMIIASILYALAGFWFGFIFCASIKKKGYEVEVESLNSCNITKKQPEPVDESSDKDEVLNLTDVATRLIARLNEIDCSIIKSKYSLDYDENTRNIDILELVGKKRGCIIRGGEIDHERAGKVLLTDFRAGKLGRIILE